MKKIKIIMSAVLVCLTMLFACIPKVSAYSEYTSDLDVEQVLYYNNHILSTDILLESGYTNYISNLTFHYGYEIIDNLTYLYIFRYTMVIYNSQTIDELVEWYIPLNQDVFDSIGTELNDAQMIDEQYELLSRSSIKMTLYMGAEGNLMTPYVSFYDYDYITDEEFALKTFNRVEPMFSASIVEGVQLDFVHTNLLNQTYLFNAYRFDGNSLSKIEDVSITDWLINSVGGLFDTPILGGVSIGDILMFVLAIGLLFLFLRFFAGG